jgi:hypothetical protein
MITHKYHDGSEGYQYQVGDKVKIKDTISDVFRDARGRTGVIERVYDGPWSIAKFDVRFSPRWGCAECFAWMLEPTPTTRKRSKKVKAKEAGSLK